MNLPYCLTPLFKLFRNILATSYHIIDIKTLCTTTYHDIKSSSWLRRSLQQLQLEEDQGILAFSETEFSIRESA